MTNEKPKYEKPVLVDFTDATGLQALGQCEPVGSGIPGQCLIGNSASLHCSNGDDAYGGHCFPVGQDAARHCAGFGGSADRHCFMGQGASWSCTIGGSF